MKINKYLIGLSACVSLATTSLTSQAAPNGPWVTPTQNVSLSAFMTYEEMVKQLTSISDRSKGKMSLESIATTVEGRDVWLAKIGDPNNTPVMVITQQHGDEPHGTEAMLDVIKALAGSNGKTSKSILDEVYVLVVPRVNPDGGSFPTRGNTDFSAPNRNSRSCFDDDGNTIPSRLDIGRGVFTTSHTFEDGVRESSYDMNRYHWADWSQSWQILCNPSKTGVHFDPTKSPVPEAQGVVDTYMKYQPNWVIDIHNQGFYEVDADDTSGVNRPGQRVTGSILWPTNDDVAVESVNLSKKMTLVMKKRSLELGNMEITRYAGGDFPGIARNAYGLMAVDRVTAGEPNVGGSVLVEISGQSEGSINVNIGQKGIGMLRNNAREMVMSVLEATADGSLYQEDPTQVDTLLLDNDHSVTNPHLDE